jgi:hypothetical protein
MFIKGGKWNFPLVRVLKGELKATPVVIIKLVGAALLIKVALINLILFVFMPENFPAPLTGWVVAEMARLF